MNAFQLEECLSEVSELLFEPSFESSHTLPVLGLVFGRMTPMIREQIEMLKAGFRREHVQVYFRPFSEGGIGITLIVRGSLQIANSAILQYNARSFEYFAGTLERGEPLLLTCYQRDRNGRLRFVTDARYDPYLLPAHYCRTASMLLEG